MAIYQLLDCMSKGKFASYFDKTALRFNVNATVERNALFIAFAITVSHATSLQPRRMANR